jgi:hypothetical protein
MGFMGHGPNGPWALWDMGPMGPMGPNGSWAQWALWDMGPMGQHGPIWPMGFMGHGPNGPKWPSKMAGPTLLFCIIQQIGTGMHELVAADVAKSGCSGPTTADAFNSGVKFVAKTS